MLSPFSRRRLQFYGYCQQITIAVTLRGLSPLWVSNVLGRDVTYIQLSEVTTIFLSSPARYRQFVTPPLLPSVDATAKLFRHRCKNVQIIIIIITFENVNNATKNKNVRYNTIQYPFNKIMTSGNYVIHAND